MYKIISVVLCIFFAVFYTVSLDAQSVYVPLNYSVYEFIERFEAKGALKHVLNSTKPFSRDEVSFYLKNIRDVHQNGLQLTSVEIDQLTYYEQEFREELEKLAPNRNIARYDFPAWAMKIRSIIPVNTYKNNRNMFSYSSENANIFIDPIVNIDSSIDGVDSLSGYEEIYRYASGFRIRGSVGERAGFYLDMRNTKEWGTRNYSQSLSFAAKGLGYVHNYGTHQFHDETIGYAIVQLAPLELEIGKNINRWGPGYRGGLFLSANATSFDQIKIKFRSKRVKYEHLIGVLIAYPRIVDRTVEGGEFTKNIYASKYISAHRFEISAAKGLDIGLNEAVIYGQRGIELAYSNPVMFIRSAEHYLGDQDNALMGADVEIYMINGWKFYGELIIDDIYTKRLGTKWYGNKYGIIAGAFHIDPFGIRNSSIRLEHTRIKAFVYTHKYPVNVYKHFNTGLGHPLGPNSDEWYLGFKYQHSQKLAMEFDFSYSRHGANPPDRNIGGNINRPHDVGSTTDIGFMEGNIERKKGVSIKIDYEPFRNMFISGNFNFEFGDNFRIDNIYGRDYTSNKLFISIRMNY